MANSPIILASTSKSRQTILRNAGLTFDSIDASVDETIVKQAFLGTDKAQDIADVATILAQSKALTVSEQHSSKWVIGTDQILICEGELFNKPRSIGEARDHLLKLAGKTHMLETSIAVARDGEVDWSYRDGPLLTMRALTPEFIGRYLAAAGADITTTVGGYKLEGIGVQLFERIQGDFFTILGLPLLPLLDYLRQFDLIEK